MSPRVGIRSTTRSDQRRHFRPHLGALYCLVSLTEVFCCYGAGVVGLLQSPPKLNLPRSRRLDSISCLDTSADGSSRNVRWLRLRKCIASDVDVVRLYRAQVEAPELDWAFN